LGSRYLAQKFNMGRGGFWQVVRAVGQRIWQVLMVPTDSLVVIEYELVPWFPAVFERWLVWRGCRLVVDYDDAIFHQYDAHSSRWVRALLGRKIAAVMRLAHTVVAGNAYLADYAKLSGAKRVEVIPTVIDLRRYPPGPASARSRPFTIGWIGSPSTTRYLLQVAPALAQVCADGLAQVCLVGAAYVNLPGVPVEHITWDEATEIEALQSFDVGIMPLPDEPWTRGKCGFKLIQYMGLGLPVVASPVGVNTEIVVDGVNGHLAESQTQWVQALNDLKQNTRLRLKLGAAGRAMVEATYCLQVTESKWLDLLKAVTADVNDTLK
jgi:glycosyltransferase involved in cell wall biosynthesis